MSKKRRPIKKSFGRLVSFYFTYVKLMLPFATFEEHCTLDIKQFQSYRLRNLNQ